MTMNDPNSRPTDRSTVRNNVSNYSSSGTIAIIAAVLVAIVIGLIMLNRDGSTPTTPAVTQENSTTTTTPDATAPATTPPATTPATTGTEQPATPAEPPATTGGGHGSCPRLRPPRRPPIRNVPFRIAGVIAILRTSPPTARRMAKSFWTACPVSRHENTRATFRWCGCFQSRMDFSAASPWQVSSPPSSHALMRCATHVCPATAQAGAWCSRPALPPSG